MISTSQSGKGHRASPHEGAEQAWFRAPEWYVQQANWISDPESIDSIAHNYPMALRLRGALNKFALAASMQEIIRRHEPLRSTFQLRGNTVFQEASSSWPFCLREFSLQKLDQFDARRALAEMRTSEIQSPFDFGAGGFLRGTLFEIAEDEHLLQLVSHRIVFDDWSADIFLNELFTLYEAYAEERPSPLPDITTSYSAYARDLQSGARREELNEQIQYWKRKLAGFVPVPALRRNGSEPQGTAQAGKSETRELRSDLCRRLQNCAREQRMSAFMILAGALQLQLSRQSHGNEAAILCCVANRDSVESENLIGPFSNRIILRSDSSERLTSSRLLQAIRETILEAYSAANVPFGEIVKALFPEGKAKDGGLLSVAVTGKREVNGSRSLAGMTAEIVTGDDGAACYDLFATIRFTRQDSVCVDFRYNSDTVNSETVRQLLDNFESSVGELVAPRGTPRVLPLAADAAEKTSEMPQAIEKEWPSAPRNLVEMRLQELWQEVLERPSIGLDHDFFALGGESLQAARLFSRIEAVFGRRLPIATILERPTVRSLAPLVNGNLPAGSQPSLIPLKSSGTRHPIFCIHAREGDVLSFRNFSKYVHPDQPLYGLQSQAVAGGTPHFSVEEMAQHYISEIRRVQPKGPYSLFGYCFGGSVAFAMALKLQQEGEAVPFLGMFYTSPPGSLGNIPFPSLPLLREKIFRKGQEMTRGGAKDRIQNFLQSVGYFGQIVYSTAQVDGWRWIAKRMGRRAANWLGRANVNVEYLNVAAAKDYQPMATFQGHATYFLPIAIPYEYSIQPNAGWARFATQGIQTVEVTPEIGLSPQEGFAKQIASHFCGLQSTI
jgi:pimeloyl-ACP methyl ester carboxylesterase